MIVRIFTTDDGMFDFVFDTAEQAEHAVRKLVTSPPTSTGLVEISAPGRMAGAIPLNTIRFIRLVEQVEIMDNPFIDKETHER